MDILGTLLLFLVLVIFSPCIFAVFSVVVLTLVDMLVTIVTLGCIVTYTVISTILFCIFGITKKGIESARDSMEKSLNK